MKLYYFKGSCALAPHITLEWVEADYRIEAVRRTATRSPEFLQYVNPQGKVPVLELDDGRKLTQVTAIQMWLARQFPDANLGPGNGEDAEFEMQSLLAHFNADVHTAFSPYFLTDRFTTDPAGEQSVKDAVFKEIGFQLGGLEERMNGREWVVDERRTVLDPYLFVFCTWAGFIPGAMDERPNLKAFAKRMKDDAGVNSALQQQGLG